MDSYHKSKRHSLRKHSKDKRHSRSEYSESKRDSGLKMNKTDLEKKYWSVDEIKKEPGAVKRYDDVIICPEGYGYQVTAKKRLRQFDLNWRM